MNIYTYVWIVTDKKPTHRQGHLTRYSTSCEPCDYEKWGMRAITSRSDLGARFNMRLSIIGGYA
jgi:hypothetical protein